MDDPLSHHEHGENSSRARAAHARQLGKELVPPPIEHIEFLFDLPEAMAAGKSMLFLQ